MLSKKRIEAAMECEDISYFYNSKMGCDETLKFINLLAQTALVYMAMLKKLLQVMDGFDYRANNKFTMSDCIGAETEAKALLENGEVGE